MSFLEIRKREFLERANFGYNTEYYNKILMCSVQR